MKKNFEALISVSDKLSVHFAPRFAWLSEMQQRIGTYIWYKLIFAIAKQPGCYYNPKLKVNNLL